MGTVRRAVKELVTMGSVVTFGDPGGDPDDEPVRRGAVWLAVQVVTAAAVLGLALLVREVLSRLMDWPGPLAIWAIPAVLLLVPFGVHFLAKPARPVAGGLAVIGTVAVVVLAAVAFVTTWTVWVLYLTVVVSAVAAATVLGSVAPARPRTAD